MLKLNAVQVLAVACFGVTLGAWIKRRIHVLDRLNIPASIVGGLLFAVTALILRQRGVVLELDLVLRDILMVAFFTTIGLSASLRLISRGGLQVLWFLLLASLGAVLQNVLGVGVAKAMNVDPLLGVIAGSVALTGGPATATAFGATFEKLGVEGAQTLGIASAMFGITAGGLLGGFIGGRLIRKHGLRSEVRGTPALPPKDPTPELAGEEIRPVVAADDAGSERSPLFNTIVTIAVSMGLGTILQAGFAKLGLTLPAYVGAMIVAAVLRNLDDLWGFIGISETYSETIGNLSLYVFIVMALLTVKLWELVNLALPMLVLLGAQVVLVWLMCLAIYRVMGKDYEAAVMAGGFCGFMLGTTANAMACMGELVGKHGPAPRAYIVVPLVGAFLIDFTNANIITLAMNLLR